VIFDLQFLDILTPDKSPPFSHSRLTYIIDVKNEGIKDGLKFA